MTPPIGSYAFLSDCRTAALTGPDGAVEWMCAPRFDAASVFNRVLDREAGGAWELDVEGAGPPERAYAGTTLILESRRRTETATVAVTDFLAVTGTGGEDDRGIVPTGALVRIVRCEDGEARVRGRVRARPDHARRSPRWEERDEGLLEAEAGLALSGTSRWRIGDDGDAAFDMTLRAGQSAAFILGYAGRWFTPDDAGRLLDETTRAWTDWTGDDAYDGYGAEHVRFSAVVLRGLMHSESGALIAAPTASLPEWPGGERNWDYRYPWHRDAALVVLVLMRLGHRREAGRFLRFLLGNCSLDGDHLKPMLTLDGGTHVAEETLDHLAGYAGSRPVRIGNKAFEQFQIDVYGQVLDAALVYEQVAGGLTGDQLAKLFKIVSALARVWRRPDDGIWEVRDSRRRWTSSALYAWVCLDRGIRLADLTAGRPDGPSGGPARKDPSDGRPPVGEWRRVRDEVHDELLRCGYDEEVGAFVQSYGAKNLDASLLRLPVLNVLPGKDPRVLSTLDRIAEQLGTEGPLIRRYDPEETNDGLGGPEGAFLLCSFDMVSALLLGGRKEEARQRFDALCALGDPLGLFAEEMGPGNMMLGNFPQAFTHLALIEAAMNLDVADQADALHAWAERRRTRAE